MEYGWTDWQLYVLAYMIHSAATLLDVYYTKWITETRFHRWWFPTAYALAWPLWVWAIYYRPIIRALRKKGD